MFLTACNFILIVVLDFSLVRLVCSQQMARVSTVHILYESYLWC